MSLHAHLPSRRDEGWRWSDLRGAVNDVGAPEVVPLGDGHIAERLMRGWAARDTGGNQPAIESVSMSGTEVLFDTFDADGGFEWLAHELVLEPGADVTRIVRQIDSDANEPGAGVWLTKVRLKAGAKYRQFVLAEGAKLARVETHVSVEGEGAQVTLNGVYLADSGRHADLTSVIEHKAPSAVTRQLIKGVARKGGRGVFQGKIVVERAAQKTDARQHHQGLLLEDGAEIFAKPELMIYADDVQCAHGNTAGGLDERALFYMRSRGIPEAEARALLIEAFLTETIPEGISEALRDELTASIRNWLAGASS